MLVDLNAYSNRTHRKWNGTEWDTVICVSHGDGKEECGLGREKRRHQGQHENGDYDDMLRSAIADNLDLNTVYSVWCVWWVRVWRPNWLEQWFPIGLNWRFCVSKSPILLRIIILFANVIIFTCVGMCGSWAAMGLDELRTREKKKEVCSNSQNGVPYLARQPQRNLW